MRKLTKIGTKINSKIGKALHDYDLISEGDRILVAVSGGKDSLTLLTLLKEIQRWAPVKFELFAAHIKTDFHCASCVHNETLAGIFEKMDIEYVFREIKVLDEDGNITCFWCSWNKRKCLFEIAEELNCNKIAMGHHKDDIVETTLMNLLYRGEISTMNPRQEMFDGSLAIIRPLCYVEEDMIRKFAAESGFSEKLCKCPFGRESRRKYVKDLIKRAEKETPGTNIKTNIFNSISKIREGYINLKEETAHESPGSLES